MGKEHMPSSSQMINVKISYDPFTAKLHSDLDTHLASLRNVLSSLSNKTYRETASQSIKGGFLSLSIVEADSKDKDIEQQEIQKAFVNIMRSFIDFLDALLGVSDFIKEPPVLPQTVRSVDELQQYMDACLVERIQKKAADRSLTKPKKLGMLPLLSSQYDLAIKDYFAIRRAIEHHKSIAKDNIKFSIQHQILFTSDGKQLRSLPIVLEGPSTISLKVNWETRKYNKGAVIVLSEEDLENLIMTLKLHIIPELISKLI